MLSTVFQGDVVSSSRILYTPSPFAKSCLTYLQEIGELTARKPHVSRRENLSSYLFFYVVGGKGKLAYLGTEYVLTAGDCVFIDCKSGYAHSTQKELWTLRWVHFFGPSMRNIYEKYLERGGAAVFHPEETSRFDALWYALNQLAASADYLRDMRINEHLSALLTLLMEYSWKGERAVSQAHSKVNSLQCVREYLEQNYREEIHLENLAERFFINKFYLSHSFKEQFGLTLTDYLLNLRITHAKQMLRFTSQTVESIGIACGLSDPNYFSRVFRKVEGISPSKYRKLWQS